MNKYPKYDKGTTMVYTGKLADQFDVLVTEDFESSFTGIVTSGTEYPLGTQDTWSKQLFIKKEVDTFEELFIELDKLEHGRTT